MAQRQTLRHAFSATTIVKKSRFVTTAGPVSTEAEARAFIRAVSEAKATHNCWAFRIDERLSRQSDDGEPGGTAGAPILAALTAGNFVRVAVVVTRYFGGIKLGTGGLARAYGGAAAECLSAAPLVECPETIDACVTVGFDNVGAIFAAVEGYMRLDSAFSNEGCVITVRLLQSEREGFIQRVRNASKGTAVVRFIESDE